MKTKTNTIDVHNVGTSVALTENIDAKITTIAIHENNSITYECSWWSGESRTKDWFGGCLAIKSNRHKDRLLGRCLLQPPFLSLQPRLANSCQIFDSQLLVCLRYQYASKRPFFMY